MQVWNVLQAARWKYRTQKWCKKSSSAHHRTSLSGYIFATKARIDNQKKNLLSNNISSTCSYNMVNFGPLPAEIVSLVWGTPQISTGLGSRQHYCTAILRRWTDGATCIRQGGHHVGHWPTFLVLTVLLNTRLQAVTYTVKVVISRQWCKTETVLLRTTDSKWHNYHLSNSCNSDNLEWPSKSHTYCKPFKMWFFVQQLTRFQLT